MNQDLIKYVECVKEHENIVYKYEEVIDTLAIPKVIDGPLISNKATPTKVGKVSYAIASALLFETAAAILLFTISNISSQINQGFNMTSGFFRLIEQARNGNIVSQITFVAILMIAIIFMSSIPWFFYSRKKKKANKAYHEQKQSEDYSNKAEMEAYQRRLAEEESRLKKESDVKNKLKKRLSESRKVLKQLYDVGIIFPKYRNFVAMNMICEYLQSGRCDKLTGSDGAYNLYESELRARIIIEKLDDIIDELEDIKSNQYLVYSAIKETNAFLSEISDEMESISESAHIAAFNSEVIARETATIKYLTYLETIKDY